MEIKEDGLSCEECGCRKNKVIDTRSREQGRGIYRRRECANSECNHRFSTYEIHADSLLKMANNPGLQEDDIKTFGMRLCMHQPNKKEV